MGIEIRLFLVIDAFSRFSGKLIACSAGLSLQLAKQLLDSRFSAARFFQFTASPCTLFQASGTKVVQKVRFGEVSLPEVLQTSPPTLSRQPDFPERPAIDRVAGNAHRRSGRAFEALAVEHERSGGNLGQVKLPLIMGTQFTAGRHSYTLR